MRISLLNLALLFFTFLSSTIYPQVVIWDLGGVLLKNNPLGMAYQIGFFKIGWYALRDMKNPFHVKKKLFDILLEMERDKSIDFRYAPNSDGSAIPYLHCLFQAGLKSGKELEGEIFQYIDSLPLERFVSSREKDLIKSIAHAMFNPEILAANTYLIDQGITLFTEVALAKNDDNSLKNRCIACSNWDALSFYKFAMKYEQLFELFEGLEISGINHHLKPNDSVFKYLIDKYNLNPKECYFIDDQLANLEAAAKFGFKTLHLHNNNYAEIRNTLQENGVL